MSNLTNILASNPSLVGSDIDETLVDVLDQQQQLIDKLKSNVKWLYKYGGVGSGGGSGSGGPVTTAWKINASLGGQTLANNKTIMFSEAGVYNLVLNVVRHNGAYYNYTIRQNGRSIFSGSFTSTDGKNYTAEHLITCADNGNLSVQVQDEDGELNDISFSYITNMFTANVNLVNNNNSVITSTELSTDIYKSQKLFLQFTYNAPVDTTIQYEIVDFDGNVHTQVNENGDLLEKTTSTKEIIKIPVSINEDLGGDTYVLTVKYKIFYDGNCIFDNTESPKKFTMSLIPDTLFLKVVSNTIKLSKEQISTSEDIKGMKSFTITPFEGSRSERTYSCTYKIFNSVTGIETSEQVTIQERQTHTVNINCANTGLYRLTVTAYNVNNLASTYSTILYFYIIDSTIDFEYYPESFANTSSTIANYYRAGDVKGSEDILSYRNKPFIEQTRSQDDIKLKLNYDLNGSQDMLLQFGIQYNVVNENSLPILKLYQSDVSNDSGSITVYPDRIYFGDEKNNVTSVIYIPKEEVTKATDHTKYHLVTIYKRLVLIDTTGTAEYYYELVVYIDGVIEASLENFINLSTKYDSLILYKGNYYINYLEATTFNSVNNNENIPTGISLSDADIVKNYYTYQYYIQNDMSAVDKLTLLEYLTANKFKFDLNTTLVEVVNGKSDVITISKQLNLPSLYLNVNQYTIYTDNNGLDFITWMQKSYGETEKFMKDNFIKGGSDETNSGTIDTALVNKLEYMAVGEQDFTAYSLPNTLFTLDIQGTSTRANKTPNFTLACKSTEDDALTVPVFTPNFDVNDKTTFLPESAFYLKADIADSAHSNNTATGKFVNKHTTPFIDGLSGKLSKHVKQCLEGFPVLVYVQIDMAVETEFGAGTISKTYFLGIYNFNLGRSSNFNLGYKDYNVFMSEDGDLKLKGGFQMLELTKDQFERSKPNITIAEVKEKDAFFDFSQYDAKVLFPINSNDTTCMYGDFVYSTDNYKVLLQNFTEQVALGGGFIFDLMGKYFGEQTKAYHAVDKNGNFLNQVPDFHIQYTRNENNLKQFIRKEGSVNTSAYTQADLLKFIIGDVENHIPAILDYDSAVEYYTICMAFGLVDSVQKNLNVKSWNEHTINGKQQGYFHIAFYDMDTGYGIDNQGDDTSHVAFSDYWYSPDAMGTDVKISDTYNNVYRDYYPEDPKEIGYDVPSTYLFAIAKYARSIAPTVITNSPQALWAEWRRSDGPLRNADYFVDNYYNSALSSVPEQLFNLNYRAKYFVLETETINAHKYHAKDWKQFKGRKLYKVRDWLNNRFHILDAYFSMDSAENQTIYKLSYVTDSDGNVCTELNENGGLKWETTGLSILKPTVDTTNSDIKYRINIFTGSADVNSVGFGCKNIDTELKLSALDYTPLMIKVGSTNGQTYMLNDSEKTYAIPFRVSSSNTLTYFYGSYYLTSIGNIAPFIAYNGSLSMYSQYIYALEGNSGSISSFNITYAPSLKTIKFTSSGYKGTLLLDNSVNSNYPLLTTVDISNSAIALTCNTVPIAVLNIANTKSSKIDITNCTYITDIIVQNNADDVIECSKLSITPSNVKNTVFKGQKIVDLTLQSSCKGSSITISDDEELTTLSLIDYENITITNCEKLTSISISGSKVKHIKIQKVAATTVNLYMCENIEYLDVSDNTTLSTLILNTSTESCISHLNISNTVIKTLNWSDLNQNITHGINGEINLVNARSLISNTTSFICNNNEGVEIIKFPNIGTPGTYLKENWDTAIRVGSFYGCKKLRHVYGNIIITDGNHTFGGCENFKIHGRSDSITNITYNGKKVAENNIVYMPYLLQASDVNVIPKSYYFDGGTESMDVIFLPGEDETNMSFDITSFDYTFDSTAVTLFDIYYVMSNANPVSSYDKATDTFRETELSFISTFGSFGWFGYYNAGGLKDKFKNYNICRYMLHNVTKYSQYFSPFDNLQFSYFVPFMSPTMSGNTCVKDDGWFSPLWNVVKVFPNQSINYKSNMKFLIDINFFRHTGDDNKSCTITLLDGLQVLISNNTVTTATEASEADDVKTVYDINNSNYGQYWNRYGRFSNNGYSLISNLKNLISISQLSTPMLDFSTIIIPDSVETLSNAFRVSYGTGILELNNVFTENSMLKNIYDYTFGQQYGNASITFRNDTFKNFKHLVNIGRNTNGITTMVYDMIFSIQKYVDPNDFPYDMFNPNVGCPNAANIETVNGLFAYTMSDLMSVNMSNVVELPGRLFKHTEKLNDLYRCFYSLRFYHSLTGSSFENCHNLQIVTEMFANDQFYANGMYKDDELVLDYPTISYFQGPIPYKFLYHGSRSASSDYTNIKRLDGLFANLDIDKYVNENPTSIWDYDGVHGRDVIDQFELAKATNSFITVEIKNGVTVTFTGKILNDSLIVDETYTVNNTTGYEMFIDNVQVTNKYKAKWYGPMSITFTNASTNENIKKVVNVESVYKFSKYDDIHYADSYDLQEDNRQLLEVNKYMRNYSKDVNTGREVGSNYNIPNFNYFCCAPDLFKYCNNMSGLNITGVFKGCGSALGTPDTVTNGVYSGKESKGLTGRIPPYLFFTLSNVTNLSYMFYNCKALSYYCTDIVPVYNKENPRIIDRYSSMTTYLVPKTLFRYTPNVINIEAMFYGNIFNYTNSFNGVLPTTKGLTATKLFTNSRWTNTDGNLTVDSDAYFVIDYPLFAQQVTNIDYLFAQDDQDANNTYKVRDIHPKQYMQFGDPDSLVNIYGSINKPIQSPTRVFAGYEVDKVKAYARFNSSVRNTIDVTPLQTTEVAGNLYSGNWHRVTKTYIYSSTRYTYTLYNI